MNYQIRVNNGLMHPTNGEPYIFKSYEEAKNMVSICYGLASLGKDVKIESIPEDNPYLETDCMGNCFSDADPRL